MTIFTLGRRPLRIAAIGCALLGAISLISACGSSGGSGGGAGSGSGKLHGAPILIGVPTVINSQIYTSPEVKPAAEAAVASVNASGGINGRPLQAVICDGQLSPTQETLCGEQWVHDQVAAVTGGIMTIGTGLGPLAAGKIPWIDGAVGTPPEADSPYVFAVGAGVPGTTVGTAKALVAGGAKHLGVLTCAESACAAAVQEFKYGAAQNGITNPKTFLVPNATVDYSSVVAQVLQSGIDGLALLFTPNGSDQIITQLRQAGFKGIIAGNGNTFSPTTISSLSSQFSTGLRIVDAATPGTDVLNPEIKALTAGMKKIDPGAPISDLAVYTWASVMIFAKIARGLKDVTAATVLAALRSLRTPINATSVSPPFTGAGPTPFGTPLNLTSVHSDEIWVTAVTNGVAVGSPNEFVPALK